jgi:hypothetical protein
MVHRGGLQADPKNLLEEKFGPKDSHLPVSPSHVGDFLNAIRTGANTICPIEEAVRADILCHLSDIAVRSSRPLKWDPSEERFLNDDEANRRLALRPMREPWRLL